MTESGRPSCDLCGGRKHVLRGGKWVRCTCVLAAAYAMRCREADVPEVLRAVPMGALKARSLYAGLPADFFKFLTAGATAQTIWLHAPQTSRARHYAVAYTLRRFIDAGLRPRRLRLIRLLDAMFDPDKAAWREYQKEIRECPGLVIEAQAPAPNKMIPQILGEILGARAGMRAVTVYASADDLRTATGTYGPEAARVFAGRGVVCLRGANTPGGR